MAYHFEISNLEVLGLVAAGACVLTIWAMLVELALDWIQRRSNGR